MSRARSGGKTGQRCRRGQRGFTLLEVLAALLVIGVATSIFMQLFRVSTTLSDTSRGQELASQLAASHLADILTNPGLVNWPEAETVEPGQTYEVMLRTKEELPTAMPPGRRSYDRTSNLYYDFYWRAEMRLPSDDANYVNVMVGVEWVQDGKVRMFWLTSCLPRSATEGRA